LLLLLGLAALVRPDSPSLVLEAVRGVLFVRPPVTAFAPRAAQPDPSLQARIESAASVPSGRLASVVFDLESGAQASVDAERSFPAASLFKLPILAEALRQDLDPNRLLEIRPEDWTDGSGVLQARVGEQLSVAELERLMIQDSDNIAALVLLDAVGIDNVNANLARLGLSGTHLVDHRRGESGDHVTTAADTAHLLELIATGRLVSPSASEQAMSLLELHQANTWLGDDLPWWLNVKVAHKWGDLPEARHDAGVVYSVRGSFVAVVLTEGMPPDAARQAIARTAGAALAALPEPSGLLHL